MNSLKTLLLQSALFLTAAETFCMENGINKKDDYSSYDNFYDTWSTELFGVETIKIDKHVAQEILHKTIKKYPFQENLNNLESIYHALQNLCNPYDPNFKKDPLLSPLVSINETIKIWKSYIKNPEKQYTLEYSLLGLKIIIDDIRKKHEQFEDIIMLHFHDLSTIEITTWNEKIKNYKKLAILEKVRDTYYLGKKTTTVHSKELRTQFGIFKKQLENIKNITVNQNTYIIDLLCNFNEQINNIRTTQSKIEEIMDRISEKKNNTKN